MSVRQHLLSRHKRLGGFTLLEVMIAVVILAVGLSSLFTSEAGAIRIAQRARTTTVATLLARCKMAEVEEKVAKEGWPGDIIEGRDECCEDAAHEGYDCEWKVERIKLPDSGEDGGVSDDDDDKKSLTDSKKKGGVGDGVLDQLAGLSKQDPGERMSGITDMFSGMDPSGSKKRDERNPLGKDREDPVDNYSEGMDPMGSMVMGFAFPMLKPVIEEGVRRATVLVKWKEGQKEQFFEVVQFLVSEQQIILPDSEDDDGGVPTGATTPATGTQNTGTTGTNNAPTGRPGANP